jgi:hypothetical protein
MMNCPLILLIFLFCFFVLPVNGSGQEMRAFNPVATPARLKISGDIVKQPAPLNVETVRSNVEGMFNAWNNGDVTNALSDNFYDKTRFGDAMQTNIPRDSKVKVMGMGSVQTLEQRVVTDPDGSKRKVTLGSVNVNSQVEFNDPNKGFVRVPGTNEIVFEMSEKIK